MFAEQAVSDQGAVMRRMHGVHRERHAGIAVPDREGQEFTDFGHAPAVMAERGDQSLRLEFDQRPGQAELCFAAAPSVKLVIRVYIAAVQVIMQHGLRIQLLHQFGYGRSAVDDDQVAVAGDAQFPCMFSVFHGFTFKVLQAKKAGVSAFIAELG